MLIIFFFFFFVSFLLSILYLHFFFLVCRTQKLARCGSSVNFMRVSILSFLSWRPTDSSTAVLLPSLDTGYKLQQRIHSTALCLVTIGVSASPVQPSHSLHPAAISTGVPSTSPLHCFTLRPSIREFHQHALLVALPCRLQYGSSISTPFSLLRLAAFNMRVPSARPSHCFTLQPSTHFGYSNSILSGCLWP